MTIGKGSKKSKAPRSPPFLDRASGFYGRLEETEADMGKAVETEKTEPQTKPGMGEISKDEQEHGISDFSEGMMEDDGATLLHRKPSRLSRRWSRKSSRKNKTEKSCQNRGADTKASSADDLDLHVHPENNAQVGSASKGPEPMLVHFSIREEADDQVLISARMERQIEIEAKEKRGGEMEDKSGEDNMKVVKRSTLKNYRKAFDRALRRGWETFVANLYSVTLTPISSSSTSSAPTPSTTNRNIALVEYR